MREVTKNRELKFKERMMQREPTLEYIINLLLTPPDKQNVLIEMMENDTLVAGCDEGDDQNGRICLFFSV